MNQKLVLITAGFPYGKGETFLETEITFLCKAFVEVVIIASNTSETQKRSVPANCKVLQLDITPTHALKLKSFRSFLSLLYFKEVIQIRKVYQKRLTVGMVKTMLISLERAKRVAEFIRQQQFDLENTMLYSYWCDDTALGLALLARKNKKIKAVSRTHGWDVYFNVHAINYLPFRAFITQNLTTIYCISNKGKDAIQNVWKQKNIDKVFVSRLGILPQEKQILKKIDATFTLVSCSNVIPLKRVELIAEAVLSYDQPIRWVHFGDGPGLNSIQEQCTEKQQSHHDIVFKGRVSNEEVIDFYRSNWLDAFINVSTSEGVPVSMMEAMSFGIPCMATDVGGNSEIVNNDNGVLFDANPTLEVIQTAFKEVLNNEGKRKVAYQTWEEKYNAQKNYTAFIQQLLSL